jgi:hypothetical protein
MHVMRYKPHLQAALMAAGFMGLVAVSAWLPRRFPDVPLLSFLFGHHRYIVFWLVVALWLFLWAARPRRRSVL